jgi:hypothetical protein
VPGMANDSIDQRYKDNNKGYNYGASLSWVEPIGHNNFIQLNYRYSRSHSDAIKNTASDKNGDGIFDYATELDTAYSNSSRSNFISQRARIAFRAQREKYNYVIGFDLDPSTSQMMTYTGDSVKSNIKRNVLNFSPMLRFNYRYDRTTNLRIDYNGSSSQPSMSQLQSVPDVSDPNNTVQGNPNLKPYYTSNFDVRFFKFRPAQQTAFIVMAGGNYVLNAIGTDITNLAGGKKFTTYRNTDGNYSGNLRFIFNTPLKNKKFTVHSMTFGSYSNSNSYIDDEENNYNALQLSERAGADFRSDYLDLGVNGNITYNKGTYSLQPNSNVQTYDYGVGGYTTIYLPWNLKLESDITWSSNSGYQSGYQKNETLWNAAISKSFLKGNAATIRFKVYDILQQRSGISQNLTSTGYTFSSYNTLKSYFMVHFIYRFQIFKGGASMRDFGGGRGGFGGGRHGGFGGRRPF